MIRVKKNGLAELLSLAVGPWRPISGSVELSSVER